jgi:transposase
LDGWGNDERNWFRWEGLSGTLFAARAGRGKQYTGAPLVLHMFVSPSVSMVPGRVRKSLVTPRRLSRLVAIPLRRVPALSHDRGRLPAMAFTLTEETAMPRGRKHTTRAATPPILNPHAAGIDIGATEIYVCVPLERDPQPIRRFGTFTQDLRAVAAWLEQCRVTSVAMESTGVYWIPLYQILESRGFEVCLVNARHVKNVPGRKTDVQDCQWLQYLHSVGLLRGSFRPPETVCAVRSILRHRENLVRLAAVHTQHIQKALNQMNLQLHHVLSDITGVTGLAILDAILAGERDPHVLAGHRDHRIKATQETIAKALVGDYRPEHLFTLRQSLAAYRQYQRLIGECDVEVQALLGAFDSTIDPASSPLPAATTSHRKPQGNAPRFDLRAELYRILGIDLTQVAGLNVSTVYTLFAELGADLAKFPSSKHFASWLGLCPDNRISGGKILSVKTRHVKHRVAQALRMAAQSLYRSHSALGAFFRWMRAKLGAPKAITATAHKLARILYHLLTTRQPYAESQLAKAEDVYRKRLESRLYAQARALGFQLVPVTGQSVS